MDSKTAQTTKLLGNSGVIEGMVLFSILKDMSLLNDFKLTDKDFLMEESKHIYNLIRLMESKGIEVVDETTINVTISTNPTLQEFFKEYGTARDLMRQAENVNATNFDSHYDALLKRNYLLELKEKGFNIYQYTEAFSEMDFEDCVNFVEHKVISTEIGNCRVGRGLEINTLELTDSFINELINGEVFDTLSFAETCPILNGVVNGMVTGTSTIIAAPSGCVDCDTEYFNGYKWVKISKYKTGDKVLQYNSNGSAELVEPFDFIKLPEKKLHHIKTKYGVDQCLSDEHTVVLWSKYKGLVKMSMVELIEKHNRLKFGLEEKFITTFDYAGKGINLSDEEIRVMCAVICDGNFQRKYDNMCRVNLKKDRKKDRLRKLLNDAHIEFEETPKKDNYVKFLFEAPLRTKVFGDEWFTVNKRQMQIILDEIYYWDGNVYATKKGNERYSFSTTIKENADFVQFCLSSCGFRSTISTYDRVNEEYLTCGKTYKRKSIEYNVLRTTRTLCGIGGNKKTEIKDYETVDGFKYCFTVPSGMLVLRRNNRIFITGNCGKSSFVLSNIIFPIVKAGEKVLLISNELTYKQYMMMLISIIATKELGDYSVTRDKVMKGRLEDGHRKLKAIQKYINENIKDKIQFINYNSGEVDIVVKLMKKYSKQGFKMAVFDTMKAENSADGKAWATLIENSKQLTYTAQECEMSFIMPYQVAHGSYDRRVLSRADLSEGKGVINVASVLLMFRKVKSDEFDDGKYAIKPYTYIKNRETGKWDKTNVEFKDKTKQYIIVTVDKNRFGKDSVHILYQFDGQYCTYKELGYCTPIPDYIKG